MKSTLLSRPGRTMLQSFAANCVRALIAALGLFGFSIASAVTPLVMDSPADILHYTNTPWSLQKTGSFTAVQNPGTGNMNWTVTVTKGTTTSHLTVYGYIEITNYTADPAPLRNVIIALRRLDGTLVSADIADTVDGDAATQAVVDPAFSFMGESLIQENAGSDALLFRDASNAPVQLNSPALVFAPGQTKRLYYTAQFKNSALNLTPGTPLYLETMVNMPLNHLMPTLLGLAEITIPTPVAANTSVTLLDTTLTTTGTVTVGSFAGLNQLLNQAAAFNISVSASGGANGGTVCNTATLTSNSTTVGTLNGAPIVIPGVNLSAQDCDDIPKIPGPRPITTTITSCSQVVTYDASLFESPNGPIVSATFNPPSGTTFPFGTTPVTFNVTDSLGISATGTLYVTVLDTDAPVITPVSNIVVSADAGQCNAVVTYATTADDCNLESVVFSPASGSTFPIGTTTVTITAKDKVGHQSTSTFTVTVNDTTAPVLTVSNFQANATTENCGANVNFSATYQDCSPVTLVYSLSPTFSPAILPGASFPIGTTTVYVKATDSAGNSSTGSFTVTVADTSAPVITAPNIQASANNTSCNAVVNFSATAQDCSGATLVYSLNADFSNPIATGATFPLGTTTVYVKATDAHGNSSNTSFTVTVVDDKAPVITATNISTTVAADGCSANVPFNATATDCSTVTMTYSLSADFGSTIVSGASFPIGTTTVYVKATDTAGNTSTGSFTVTVVDDKAPVITVTNVSTSASTETCNANVTFNATATDCSAVTLIYSLSADFSSTISSGASFPIGNTTVYVKATDAAGNSATSSFTVTVVDDKPPVLTATNIQANVAAGSCEASVTFNATATDCSAITYVYSLNASFSPAISSGASFPVGTTTVYVKATDAHGNSSTKTFTVTVVDDKAPVISATNIQTTIAPGACAANVTFNATATDCGTYTLVYSLNSSFSPTISSGASFPIGTTTVYVKATDAAGNSSTSSFTVTVIDNQGPVITATNIQTAAAPGTCGANVTFNATAADCSGATLIYSLSATFSPTIASGANFPVGTTTVYVKATDSFGNTSTSSFTVTVQDTQPPTITSPLNNLTIQPDVGQCYATFSYTPAATDNCAGTVTVSVSPASGTQLAAGTTTTITVTATDSAGNVTTRTFTVTVGVCLGKLGNFVWKDLDNDGVQDAGEPGVDGVKVTLYTSGGVQVGSPVFTSGGGFYLFDNLIPGDYYVIFDKTTLPAGYVFTTQNTGSDATDSDANPTTGKSEGNATVVAGGYNDTVDAGIIIPTAPCVPATLTFSGSSSVLGTAGNIRTYSVNGTSVKVSAFSRTKGASGTWAAAYLGVYSGGLGVTDTSEDGSGNSHTVNNVGRDNFVLFEFSQPVVINRAYLGYVATDSDLTAWVGNVPNAYNNHVTLSDTVLNSLVREQNAGSSSARWATLNAGQISGNVLVIAADVFDTLPNDYFKIAALDICAPAAPLSLACVSVSTGTVGTPFSSALVASGGKSPYTYSIVSGSLPNGLTLNASTGAITGTPTAAGTFNFTAKVVDSSSGVAQTTTVNCGITIAAAPVCVPSTFTFSGNTAGDGTDGNSRTFTVNGITVKATAFSRSSAGSWAAAYLGAFSGGLGVTDSSEDGNSNSHTVDNVGRDNFVVFAFSQPVVVNRAYLGYVVGDSDLTAWVGNISNAYTSNVMLSDSVLNSLTTEESLTDSNKPRWAKINAGGISGNVLIIAASLSDDTPDDYFKIAALDICQPTTTNPVSLGCVSTDTGKVGVAYSSSLRAEGGTPGYTFSIVSGSLPPGLSLNTSTGAITGTPTTAGSFSFTAKVVDSTGLSGTHTATQNCCITIAPSSTTATGKIGSLVWKDKDGDGIQDAGEPGIAGITVQLKNSSGTVIKTDVTDSEGVYEFTGLSAGSYTVVVSTPSGYTKSPSNVGSNRAVDSNGSPASVTLATNSSIDLTIDFGFVPSDYCPKPLVTFTQGGWGSTPKGNNPGAFLTKNFSAVYPSGFVAIGTSSKYLAFTSAAAVINFLPQGGTAGTLSGSAVNPTSSSAGVLAGQLLAATLNVDFSNAGRTATGLASKRIGAGPLKGKTVAEVIALADSVIAGGSLPSGLTLSGLNDTLTNINENYDNGDNNGYLY